MARFHPPRPSPEALRDGFVDGYNLAFAFTCGAAYVALGKRHDRRTALVVAAFLIAALFSDGALAPVGLLLVVALIVILWPARLAALALVPAVIAHAAWFALDKSEAGHPVWGPVYKRLSP